MYFNAQQNLPLLNNIPSNITFLSDMESDVINSEGETEIYYGYTNFIQLDQQYPDSKFIFNTRDIDKWILSRKLHNNGTYLKMFCKLYKKRASGIEKIWREHWHTHTENVKNYFQDKPNKLLRFELGKSTHIDLLNFLKDDIVLNPTIQIPHLNKTIHAHISDMPIIC